MDRFVIPDFQPEQPFDVNGGTFPGRPPSGIVVERIGGDLYKFNMPDGSVQIVNGLGEVINSN